MDAASVISTARHEAGLTLRALAARAGTSHSTIAAYESAAKVPSVDTLARIVRAAGFALDARLARRVDDLPDLTRGDELASVLELAQAFPARHEHDMTYPVFGR